MPPRPVLPISIAPATGAILLGPEISLRRFQHRDQILALVAPWVRDEDDMQTGYTWLTLEGLSLGTNSAKLSLCFRHGIFVQASFWPRLENGPRSWSEVTDQSIRDEIAFMVELLEGQLGPRNHGALEHLSWDFPWGEVWSGFNQKDGTAAHGIRYHEPAAPGAGRLH